MENYAELFEFSYSSSRKMPTDQDWHQMSGAIDLINGESSNADSVAVGMAMFSTIIQRVQLQGGWTYSYYMLFLEMWGDLSKETCEFILYQTIPKIATAMGNPGALWFIDTAIRQKMYALLHISFIEPAVTSPELTLRGYAAYALEGIPDSYWVSVDQRKRRVDLVKVILGDPVGQVRNEIVKLRILSDEVD